MGRKLGYVGNAGSLVHRLCGDGMYRGLYRLTWEKRGEDAFDVGRSWEEGTRNKRG